VANEILGALASLGGALAIVSATLLELASIEGFHVFPFGWDIVVDSSPLVSSQLAALLLDTCRIIVRGVSLAFGYVGTHG
jgi:hypothetical protein